MLDKFKENIEKNFPFLEGKSLLLACSGGVDSIVLVHLMRALDYNIALAHCNFSLRGKESDKDADFVKNLAKQLSVPVFVETFDTHKYARDLGISTQMAARDLRYAWFDEILENFKFDYILTAHHLDDDLETFFINLSRGSGLRGLSGIPKINKRTIRPLLQISRVEVESYARENTLNWREDKTNLETDYLRNKLRIDVLPKFKQLNPYVLNNYLKSQQILHESYLLLEDYIAIVYKSVVLEHKDSYIIDINKLKQFPNHRALVYELFKDFGFTEWDDVYNLLAAQTGKQVFSGSYILLKNRDNLILTKKIAKLDHDEYCIEETSREITFPINLKFEIGEYIDIDDRNLIQINLDKLTYPLKLRKWRAGDSFKPFGMKGRKKLSKYFKDEKVARTVKEKTWLLLSEEKIVWVIGFRMDEDFRVNPESKEVLKIKFDDL